MMTHHRYHHQKHHHRNVMARSCLHHFPCTKPPSMNGWTCPRMIPDMKISACTGKLQGVGARSPELEALASQAPGEAGFRNVRISPEKILIWWASDIPWSPLVSLASFSLASLGTGIPMHQKHGHRFKELQYIVDQRPRDRIKLDRHILSWPNDHHHSAVTVLWYHSPSPPEPFHPRLNDALRWDL